ncbi:MAG: hypothetical protein ABIB04_02010 [Patescibacteria group bacterium]
MFGKKPAGTVIRGLGSLHETDAAEAFAYLVHYEGEELVREGSYASCLGPMATGGYVDGEFAGSLELTDEEATPANIMYTVPKAE